MILRFSWLKGRGFLILQKWKVGFDPFIKTPQRNLLWVKFPGLPLELWDGSTTKEISNSNFYY